MAYEAYDNKFNQGAHRDTDAASKIGIIKWFALMGFKSADNTTHDNFAVDLKLNVNGKIYSADVERRQPWSGEEFPWKSIHIPIRKAKFFSDNYLNIVINAEQTHCLICRRENISRVITTETPRDPNERFFDVPVKDCEIFDMNKDEHERLLDFLNGVKKSSGQKSLRDL